MPSLVLFDELPKPGDGVKLEADSCLDTIGLQCLGVGLKLSLNQEQNLFNLNRATNVFLHVMYVQLQVLLGGDMLQLLQVHSSISCHTWRLHLAWMSELTDEILLVLTMKSKML